MALRRRSPPLFALKGKIAMGWSKEKAVKVIVACAEKYENELNGRKLLLLFYGQA